MHGRARGRLLGDGESAAESSACCGTSLMRADFQFFGSLAQFLLWLVPSVRVMVAVMTPFCLMNGCLSSRETILPETDS